MGCWSWLLVDRCFCSWLGSWIYSWSCSWLKSFSILISLDIVSRSELESSDESLEKYKEVVKSKWWWSFVWVRDEEKWMCFMKYDGEYVWKKVRIDGSLNSYKREKICEWSSLLFFCSWSRLWSRSWSLDRLKKYCGKYECDWEMKKWGDWYCNWNGVDYWLKDKGCEYGRYCRWWCYLMFFV